MFLTADDGKSFAFYEDIVLWTDLIDLGKEGHLPYRAKFRDNINLV